MIICMKEKKQEEIKQCFSIKNCANIQKSKIQGLFFVKYVVLYLIIYNLSYELNMFICKVYEEDIMKIQEILYNELSNDESVKEQMIEINEEKYQSYEKPMT